MMHADPAVDSSPSGIRHQIVRWATLMSLLLYLDRYCISICTSYIRQDLNVSAAEISLLSSAFFLAYALCQVPSGWLVDKFGVRAMLSIFILAWSACIGLHAFAQTFFMLALLQFCNGMAQAGAYPAGARLIREWTDPLSRGKGSAMIALGGRAGAALASILTAWMLLQFVPVSVNSHVTSKTVLDPVALSGALNSPTAESSSPKLTDRQLAHIRQLLTPAEQATVSELAPLAAENAAARKANPQQPVLKSATAAQTQQIQELLNRLIDDPQCYVPDLYDDVIEKEGKQLSAQRKDHGELTAAQQQRLNRLALEFTFRGSLGNVYVSGWRPTMIVYGALGIVVAFLFWWQVRDTPADDPRPNAAERRLIRGGLDPEPVSTSAEQEKFPWMTIMTNASLWGNCLMQFTTNIGWLFLVRNMPDYLEQVHGVSLVMRGWMTSVPVMAGVVGVFLGGRLTDWLVRKVGLKWGRRLPVVLTRFTCALGYLICVALSYLVPKDQAPEWMPWVYVASLSIVAVSTDMGIPAVWAFAQDIGGKYTASILGWANMWGNLGASPATWIYARILGERPTLTEWNTLFVVLAGVFLLGTFGAILMDATKPLTAKR